MSRKNPETLDCRSPEGEAVMMIDSLIIMMRMASRADLSHPQVREALEDLYFEKATQMVFGSYLDHVRRGEIAAGRNRLNRRHDATFGPSRDDLWCGGPFRFRKDPLKADLAIYTVAATRRMLDEQ